MSEQPDWPEDDLETLAYFAETLEPKVSLSQLRGWEDRRETTGFPERKRQLGRYPFFSIKEVVAWYALWRKATRNYTGQADRLNGGSS